MRLALGVRAWVGAVVAGASLAVSCAGVSSAAEPVDGGGRQPPQWHGCAGGDRFKGLECATLKVPLDYAKPGGRKIDLEISRVKAADPAERRGILLINPGGPGGHNDIHQPYYFAHGRPEVGLKPVSKAVLDRYDLIGFDPRFSGQSTPITCGLPDDGLGVPSGKGFEADVARSRTVAESCGKEAGWALPYISTRNNARDMDSIRQALGADKISYAGKSYGSYLGMVYADMFPEHTDRFELDAVMDPSTVWYEGMLAKGPTGELKLDRFSAWAAPRNEELHLGDTPATVRKTVLDLITRLDEEPADGGTVNGDVIREVVQAFDNDAIAREIQRWSSPQPPQPAPTAAPDEPAADAPAGEHPDNYLAVKLGTMCGDAQWPRDPAVYKKNLEEYAKKYPIAGAMVANILPCAFWPSQPSEEPVLDPSHAPGPMLLSSGLYDFATPFAGAERAQELLPAGTRMIKIDTVAHVNYRTGNPCVDDPANTFLATGKLPGKDLTCPATASGG
ncbi:alpha/beta fold hydrolase [Streptomyces sp. NPDC004667]|uniref:alpha/beta fold hydrolase n=1 Tax=Streptomyces sp. NPDC004667 TaxID=3154285 RepID=UPI0033BB4253